MVEARQFSLTLTIVPFFTARLITSSNAAILHLQKLGRSNVTHHFLSDKMGKPVPKRISCIINVREKLMPNFHVNIRLLSLFQLHF